MTPAALCVKGDRTGDIRCRTNVEGSATTVRPRQLQVPTIVERVGADGKRVCTTPASVERALMSVTTRVSAVPLASIRVNEFLGVVAASQNEVRRG